MKKILVYTLNEAEINRRASVPPGNRKKLCAVWGTDDGIVYHMIGIKAKSMLRGIDQVNSWADKHGYKFYIAVEVI